MAFVVTATAVALVRLRTSPLYPAFNDINSDVYVFQMIGNSWRHGLLPYRDVYDVKGPFLYLLFGLFAAVAPWSMWPVLIFSAVLVLCGLCLAYGLARLHVRRRWLAGLAAITSIVMIYLAPVGVHTSFSCEELAVPGVVLLLWLTIRWLRNRADVADGWWILDGMVVGALLWSKYLVVAPWLAMLLVLLVLAGRGLVPARALGRVIVEHLIGIALVTAVLLPFYAEALPDLLRAYFVAKAGGVDLANELTAQGAFAADIWTENTATAVLLLGVLAVLIMKWLRCRDRERVVLALAYVGSLWASLALVRHENNLFVPLTFCTLAVPVALGAVEARRPEWVGWTAVGMTAATAVACVPATTQAVTDYGLLGPRKPLTCYDSPSKARSSHDAGVSTVFARVAGNRPILSVGTLFAARSAYIAHQPMTARWQFVDRSWAAASGADHAQTRYLMDGTFPFVWVHVAGLETFDDLQAQIAGAARIPPAQARAINHNYVPLLTCNNEILLRAR